MTLETIRVERQDGVATVTLNRPDRLNSFTAVMHEELAGALATIADDADVRAVLLTGAGRGFCAGQDLADRAVSPGSAPVDLGETVGRYWSPLIRRITSMDKPVVCAVNGVAAGAGASVALACDMVFAARSARFIQSFANIGLIPDSGGTWALPRLVGQARALGLALTGDPLSAEQAADWGLIWRCVDDDALMTEAKSLATRFAAGPTRGFAATKRLIRASFSHTLEEELDIERATMRDLGFTADYQEGVAAFTAKRPAMFTGR